MRKRGFCCRPVPVRPSVMSCWCIVSRRLKIVKLLSRPGSLYHSSFLTPSADTKFQEEPLQRERKIHGVGEICDFRLKSPFISETVRDRLKIAMKREYEVIGGRSICVGSDDLK